VAGLQRSAPVTNFGGRPDSLAGVLNLGHVRDLASGNEYAVTPDEGVRPLLSGAPSGVGLPGVGAYEARGMADAVLARHDAARSAALLARREYIYRKY
jgi:hypothetical protein